MQKLLKMIATSLVAAPVLMTSAQSPALADAIIEQRTTTVTSGGLPIATSSSSEEIIDVKKGVQYKFRERIANLQEQIDNSLNKGWMNAAQAGELKSRGEALLSETARVEGLGFPKSDVDVLEKSVTKFNADVSSAATASNGGASEIK